jgi:hypothetical protein
MCSGGTGAVMAVIGDRFLYEASDPIHPRMLCRSSNTLIHLIDGNAIVYTRVANGETTVVRHELATGVESSVARLPADPLANPVGAYAAWTSDGLLEAFATSSAPDANGRFQLELHLWSKGADHVLQTIDRVSMGFESRWSPFGVVEFSPDHAYVAFSPVLDSMRIFSVGDLTQVFAVATRAVGGTWISNDRFVWAVDQDLSKPSGVIQWTPSTGATVLRQDYWYAPTSSRDGAWLAATEPFRLSNQADTSYPRVVIVSVGGAKVLETGPGSAPGFISPTVAWYAEEGPCSQSCISPNAPNGTIHALDVTNGNDQTFHFRVGEEPTADGNSYCCFTGAR